MADGLKQRKNWLFGPLNKISVTVKRLQEALCSGLNLSLGHYMQFIICKYQLSNMNFLPLLSLFHSLSNIA